MKTSVQLHVRVGHLREAGFNRSINNFLPKPTTLKLYNWLSYCLCVALNKAQDMPFRSIGVWKLNCKYVKSVQKLHHALKIIQEMSSTNLVTPLREYLLGWPLYSLARNICTPSENVLFSNADICSGKMSKISRKWNKVEQNMSQLSVSYDRCILNNRLIDN